MILRSPRLAIVASRPEAVDAVVAALAVVLRGWHIPAIVYCDGPAPDRQPPWSPLARHALTELRTAAEAGLDEQANRWAVANGGDVTLLAGTAASETAELAALTRTPVIAARASGDGEDVLRTLAAPGPLRGVIAVDDAGLAVPDGALDLGRGAASLPADWLSHDAPLAELDAPDLAHADRLAEALDLLALLRLGSEAPALVARARPSRTARRPAVGAAHHGRGRVLAVQGTHSSAGKSFLVAGLARHFADRGVRVAPFKGQNMSNNARVVDGGEIGVAQHLQAVAARTAPDVRMNPVLLKPHDEGSQVIAMGRPRPELTALPWRLRKPVLWPLVRDALRALTAEYELVIVEGAGSPAESFMYHNDIVNMRVAREARATTILVSDAGQGGAIAQSYGTWRMLREEDRTLVGGFVFNKFYGSGYVDLFLPGVAQLERLTGVPSLGILPQLDFSLPEEDLHSLAATAPDGGLRIAIVSYPKISNFDEFAPLQELPGHAVAFAQSPEELAAADWVILPGSKNVALDLAWMRTRGLDAAVRRHAQAGRPLVGICGGLQMLGEQLDDPVGVEGSGDGLGVLPLRTTYAADKVQERTVATFDGLEGAWSALNGVAIEGYQIRHGRTAATGEVAAVLPDGSGFAAGNVLALSVHGIFENAAVLSALFGADVDPAGALDARLDRLGAALERHLDLPRLERLLG